MHEKHRSRVKQRFLTDGLESFEDHQVLEFILFYAIPRVDTNPTAHILLEKFGSLHGVADAPIEELMTVPHIKEHAATLLKMIPEISRRYFLDSVPSDEVYDTIDKIGEYFVKDFIGATSERLHMLLLDSGYHMIKDIPVMEGSLDSVPVPMRAVIREITRYDASIVVLAHNHTGGSVTPSDADINTTINIINAFAPIKCYLLEHLIISKQSFLPIIESNPMLRTLNQKAMK